MTSFCLGITRKLGSSFEDICGVGDCHDVECNSEVRFGCKVCAECTLLYLLDAPIPTPCRPQRASNSNLSNFMSGSKRGRSSSAT